VSLELAPNIGLHDLIKSDTVLTPVVELRGAGGGVGGHLAGLLERAAVLEGGRDARAAESVVAHLVGDAGCLGPAAHHREASVLSPMDCLGVLVIV